MNDDKDLGNFMLNFLTVLGTVGRHVSAFRLALHEGRYADARREFINARNKTLRYKFDPRTPREIRLMLNEMRRLMYQTLAEYGFEGVYRLIRGR